MYAAKHRGHSSQQQQQHVDVVAMGGGAAADGHGHRAPPPPRPAPRHAKLKILLVVIATNLVSVYLFSGASLSVHLPASAPRIHLWDSAALLRDLNATRAALSGARAELSALRAQCNASSLLLESVLAGLGAVHGDAPAAQDFGGWPEEPRGEMKLAVEPHRLPLGYNVNFGTDELFPGLGFACRNFQDELARYMSYDVGAECPDVDAAALQLMLKGCEPLPRRRCRARSPAGYPQKHHPAPLPRSLWSVPPDTTVRWEPYTCKNYTCLVNRARVRGGSYFCKDCFDLDGKERRRWLADNGGPGFSIDAVLRTRPPGTVRVGLDVGGGTGTFAARMAERNVTVVTTTLDLDAPFNAFVAARGLVPLQISLAQRLPFADGVLDIVHSMNALGNWVPDALLEAALFDIYRVLRPGGIFWLDHFFCLGPQLNATYVPIFDRVGFHRLRWNAGRKLDLGPERNEWYVSALLEKPMT